MRILLTNDDGIESPGLHALQETLGAEHEIWTVAPAEEQSATSHSVTLREAIRTRRIDDRTFSCWGTPVDCVLLASNGLMPPKPDLVVSGINKGANLGSDITFSGTAAASRQAAMLGLPSVAISIASFVPPFHFETAADFLDRNTDTILRLWRPDHFLNINVPNRPADGLPPVLARPALTVYEHNVRHFTAPDGDRYFFYSGVPQPNPDDEGTEVPADSEVLAKGRITLSPIYLYPTLSGSLNRYDPELFN